MSLALSPVTPTPTRRSRRDAALLAAGRIRLRPILMTTLALILGMLPVSLGLSTGSSFRQPMAVTVIGGLITSTILTVLLGAYGLQPGGRRARAVTTLAGRTRCASDRHGSGQAGRHGSCYGVGRNRTAQRQGAQP